MPARFINIDHNTPLLLPPDLRDWIAPDHMVHFIMDSVASLDLSVAHVNERGTGRAQYPPYMMLGLLIYCYATGTFSSRRIEALTYENVAVRYLTADTHPDHDSICKFRRDNKVLLGGVFHQVLEMAARAHVLKVGDLTVAVEGTKILANASKHSAVSYDHCVEQMQLAETQIAELLEKAETADSTPLQDGLTIPDEIASREKRIAALRDAATSDSFAYRHSPPMKARVLVLRLVSWSLASFEDGEYELAVGDFVADGGGDPIGGLAGAALMAGGTEVAAFAGDRVKRLRLTRLHSVGALESREAGGEIAAAEEVPDGGEDVGAERAEGGAVFFLVGGEEGVPGGGEDLPKRGGAGAAGLVDGWHK